jgi:predicted short-subunit dehydrogenase-like oxidoreductase (DUF2520 family)
MKSLNIVGCGAVGKVFGRLFCQAGLFEIQDIQNRSLASGQAAAAFIGEGRPVAGQTIMRPADLYLIGCSDDAIGGCAKVLASSGLIRPGAVAFHLSGALPSALLAPIREAGAAVASVHAVKSFADASASVSGFAGTWCGIEGDPPAVALLTEAFGAIGGKVFSVDPLFKTIYHAGSVMVCNYLTSLVEVGLRAYEKGGVPRQMALQAMEPLVRGTLDNIFLSGTVQALTGPIARGDAALVAGQLAVLDGWDGEVALVYRVLGRVALELSRRLGAASDRDLVSLEELFAKNG